ncbi:DsbA family protein, partial [Microbacteriaceae bacterium K1510]|nr:DsbA family protein [Microbacteriaceae bacterium K1510]
QDTVCPWCRIGKQNLFTAIRQWDGEPVTLRYRSFFLDPNVPEQGLPFRESMAAITGPGGLDQMFERVTAAGAAAGLTFRFDRVAFKPNTSASHQLIKLASEEKATEMVEAIYQAYFE